jgi:hypothetical protein
VIDTNIIVSTLTRSVINAPISNACPKSVLDTNVCVNAVKNLYTQYTGKIIFTRVGVWYVVLYYLEYMSRLSTPSVIHEL